MEEKDGVVNHPEKEKHPKDSQQSMASRQSLREPNLGISLRDYDFDYDEVSSNPTFSPKLVSSCLLRMYAAPPSGSFGWRFSGVFLMSLAWIEMLGLFATDAFLLFSLPGRAFFYFLWVTMRWLTP